MCCLLPRRTQRVLLRTQHLLTWLRGLKSQRMKSLLRRVRRCHLWQDNFSTSPVLIQAERDQAPHLGLETCPGISFQLPKFKSTVRRKKKLTLCYPRSPKWNPVFLTFPQRPVRRELLWNIRKETFPALKEDIPTEEEDKDTYPDEADRASTWSTDSNHGSTGSQNDLDEVDLPSKKGPILSYGDHFLSGIHGEDYEGPGKQQPVEVNKPSRPDPHPQEGGIREIPLAPPVPRDYRPSFWNPTRHGSEEHAIFSPEDQFDRSMNLQYCMPGENTTKYSSASTVTTTEKRYGSSVSSDDLLPPETRRFASSTIGSTDQRFGTLPSVDEMLTSDHRSSLSGYEERSVTTIVREARWDKTAHAGAKGDTRPDPNIHYSSYRVITPDSAHQLPLKGSDQEYSSRRYASATGDRPSMGGMPASSRDSASASDSEPPASSANVEFARRKWAICWIMCTSIRESYTVTSVMQDSSSFDQPAKSHHEDGDPSS
ncbi:uncharacterized protein ACOB8E_006212 isoform 2-T2 [Sarcophilus harrisii]